MKYLVIVSAPDQKTRRFELKGKRIGLGREVDNDISINVDSVSSSHLEFRKTDEGYDLVDLDSTNGTRVNGKAVDQAKLADGDRILVGETVPVHFVALAEGEKYEASTDAGTEKDQAAAADYAAMTDKLEKLEANIEEKEEEATKLDEKLAALQKDFAAKQAEHQAAKAELDKLQAEVESKKQAGPDAAGDVAKLEDDLMKQTRKVKLMASNLANQEQTIEELEQSKAASPADEPAAAAPAKPEPVPPAKPAAPAEAEPAPGPVMPKAPAAAPRRPLPPGAPTVKLTKKMPNPGGPPRLPRRPPPGQDG